jgi:transposase-like protein
LDTNFWGFFMTKYNEQFKLEVVEQYLAGSAAYKEILARARPVQRGNCGLRDRQAASLRDGEHNGEEGRGQVEAA